MLALLFCLILLTRCTLRYFTGKVFRSMERRSSSPRRNSAEEPITDTSFISDNEEDVQDLDDEVLVDEAAATRTSSKSGRRVNSVIDSVGVNEAFMYPEYYTPRRTRSQPTEETSFDHDYSDTPEESECRRQPDAVDAHVENVPNDDEYPTCAPATISVKIPVQREAECYNMNHKNRGKCVIFNHETFDGSDPRVGSGVDALTIKATFANLGFDVEICDDLCYNEIITKISDLSEEDHTDNDCICIFVLTHGHGNDLISAKDVFYKSDNIWKPFTADKCTTLAGKPKLFFFQACRGDQLDGGIQVFRFSERTETDSSAASYKIPTHADFLLAHSTVQGFLSWRHPEDGTWYVQCLCRVIDEYWTNTDLLSMLTITARKVASDYASYHDLDPARNEQKQVPSVTSMLIRDIYFTPKKQPESDT